MKWHKIVGLLLAVMLAAGLFAVAPIPVQAMEEETITDAPNFFSLTRTYNVSTGAFWIIARQTSQWMYTSGHSITFSLLIDGVQYGTQTRGNDGNTNITIRAEFLPVTLMDGASHFIAISGRWEGSTYEIAPRWAWTWTGHMVIPYMNNTTHSVSGAPTGVVTYIPVSVAIVGSSSVAIGSTSSYTATIVGGTAPFTGHWTLTGLQTSLGPTAGVVGTTSVMPWTFGTVKGLQNIRYDVTDSVGGTAYALIDVRVGEYAPALKGQLYFAGDELRFCLYPQASNPVGEYVEPGTENVMNTDNYTIDRVILGLEWAYYRLADVAPLANPYVVHVSYVDPTNGRVYPYTFSFDTTLMAGGGDWGQGDGSHGGGELPSWVQALVDIMKEGFRALFVPTDLQMNQLMPSGTLGASLLEGTTWGSGASTWNMHVHWGAHEITLVSMNFATIADYGFVRAVRYCIQAGISLGLVYLVVVLI